jgi:hypothetical protein
MSSIVANTQGIRKLIADGYGASKHDKLAAFYAEVREYWFEMVKRARIAKRQKETKQAGGNIRKPVGRILSTDIISQLERIAATYKLPGIKDAKSLIDFLKQYPPSRNASCVHEGAKKQIERRDAGFKFEADLTHKLRNSGQYVWVGRSAGSYGAIDIVAISRKGLMFAQCKATEAERSMKSDHGKLVKLHGELGHLAELRLYFLREGQTVFVKLDESTLPKLAGKDVKWKVVTATTKEITRSASEYRMMIEELSTRLHWQGSTSKLSALYQQLIPFWKKLAKAGFQWSGPLRIEFRTILDAYRGFLSSQDAHVTKALMIPKFAPIEIVKDDAHTERDYGVEQKIFKKAGFSMRVEKEPGYRSPIHVLRSTTNGSKIIAYFCVRDGYISDEDVKWLASTVERLPKQVEFRVAWYVKRELKTKTVKSEADLQYFSKQRGA